MNKAKLKSYAPQARKDFIAAVTARANLLGLSEKAGKLEVATSQPQGDATVIAGQAWPIKVHSQRQQLIARIQKDGFAQTMEAVAYTWFNRFAALRYMELHDYLGHGHRALSSLEGTQPDILTHAADLAQNGAGEGGLPGLNPSLVVDMKLAGNRDGELYRLLLVAQCNALSNVMPFLFERIDDETELLLPDNLLRTDSVVANLVTAIDEEDWGQVEIIGWLYQFYISEKKDEVIGKVVEREDIPAATQLFTPNWIVRYLVQNTVGRLWLTANPTSSLKSQWPYHIELATQTSEVQAQLDMLVETRVNMGAAGLSPESITLLDPACGSGHILVEAYETFKSIYLERGYQPRNIPRLILEKNLYGLDIDDRAAQMAGFALLMKARADDRRLFDKPILLNVLSLQESKGLDADSLSRALEPIIVHGGPQLSANSANISLGQDNLLFDGLAQGTANGPSIRDARDEIFRQAITVLIKTFEHGKTFGSLIQIPETLNSHLAGMAENLRRALESGDLYAKAAAQDLQPIVAQAQILAKKFDAVVANPPYMNNGYFESNLKSFVAEKYAQGKADLYGCYILRGKEFCVAGGFLGMITIPNWMFLAGFEKLRDIIFGNLTIESLIHNGRGIWGSDFGSCSFVFRKNSIPEFRATYKRLFDVQGSVSSVDELNQRFFSVQPYINSISEFKKIPSHPIAYWMSKNKKELFSKFAPLGHSLFSEGPCKTGNDETYLRFFWEVSAAKINADNGWCFCSKGGSSRKYFGNIEHVILWTEKSRAHYRKDKIARISSESVWNRLGITWTIVTAKAASSFRILPSGCKFNSVSPSIFQSDYNETEFYRILALLNSKVAEDILGFLNPTLAMNVGNVLSLPYDSSMVNFDHRVTKELIQIYEVDWNLNEFSFGFRMAACLLPAVRANSLEQSWNNWRVFSVSAISRAIELEQNNNRYFIDSYGLQDELSPDVLEWQMDLVRADREKDCQRLISYAIGCVMGRYSLDSAGLVFANEGGAGFNASQYVSFLPDFDGIVPTTDVLWFGDEATGRIREFLLAVWGSLTFAENMTWLAEGLGGRIGETPDETLRRYVAEKFYKDHLQTFKRRPIYWLFSSGKQGAFQALVYLHRYHEGTLSRMRAEYVVPLTGKIQSRIDMLEKDAAAASSTAARNKLTKEVEKFKKKHVELLAYDEQLRHYADMRINLDLDDGVKVNYSKFGDLLAEVKAVTGGGSDD